MATHSSFSAVSTLGRRAQELYERLRPDVETPENIGKLIVMDVESGDYEIDDSGIETSRRLQSRHPNALRIGYKAVETLGGILEPTKEITEVELLYKINEGRSSEGWERYYALTAKRRAENLTLGEYAELTALTNEREIAHARRIKFLVELANLRQTSLDAVMEALGIRSPGYV